jgi:hypothetical protein
VFLALTVLNIVAYGLIYRRQRTPLALHLALISLVALLGGLPEDWGRSLTSQFSREKSIGAGAALYVLVCTAFSRHPKAGVLGGLVAATAVCALGQHPQALHWATQTGLAFLLLHSLRWSDPLEAGAALLRWLAGVAWVAHSLIWTHLFDAGWMPCAVAVPVLGVFLASRWLQGQWGSVVVPIASLLVMLSPPSHSAVVQIKSAPAGLLAVLTSFVLFGLGTFVAVSKHHWASQKE